MARRPGSPVAAGAADGSTQQQPETIAPDDQGARPILFPAVVWVAALTLAGCVPAVADDVVLAPWAAGLWALAGIGLAVARLATGGRPRHGDARSTRRLVAVALAGAGLGLFAWLTSLVAWLTLQITLGGRAGAPSLALAGAVAGAVLGWGVGRLLNGQRVRRRLLLGGATLLLSALAVLFVVLTGPRDLSRYPDPAASPYRLPWTPGVPRLCVQGNRAVVSHRAGEEFAYDFAMPVGSDVCAARAGVVCRVDTGHDGNGPGAPNNGVLVDHGDGTFGGYYHVRQHGSYVRPGQPVRQGERLAASGNVGRSLLPHLHFEVTDEEGRTLPVTFADVPTDAGVPRMFGRYTSGNGP